MDKETKETLKKTALGAEAKVIKSLLRWKYQRQGNRLPDERQLLDESHQITGRVNEVLTIRGKKAWTELKTAYAKGTTKQERPEE